ncbi:hypothetical protein C5X78_009515, partial [Klebsiella pneumoniae subsp. pneumoniae]
RGCVYPMIAQELIRRIIRGSPFHSLGVGWRYAYPTYGSLGVGWRYAYPTYGSRHGELKIPMPGVGSRLTRPAFGDLSILLKIPAIKRGFLALTRRVK